MTGVKAQAEALLNGMFPTKDDPYGGFNRYAVHLRLTDDLTICPSSDDFKSYVVWAQDPYAAHSSAIFTAQYIEGRLVRHVVGMSEMPHRPTQEARHDD